MAQLPNLRDLIRALLRIEHFRLAPDVQLARQLADGGRPRARAFVDLVRRAAELRGDHDVELWALLHPGPAGGAADAEEPGENAPDDKSDKNNKNDNNGNDRNDKED